MYIQEFLSENLKSIGIYNILAKKAGTRKFVIKVSTIFIATLRSSFVSMGRNILQARNQIGRQ